MGMSEILEFLKEQKEPVAGSDIAKAMNENPCKIHFLLNKLLKQKEISRVEIDRVLALQKYGCKKRMNLYIIVR